MIKLEGDLIIDNFQCAIPVFEGLLPKKQDRIVQKLLFELGTWHGHAKLRMHLESTLWHLVNSTTRLGDLLRLFEKEVCSAYETYDLPSEEAARGRRKTAAAKKMAEKSQAPNNTNQKTQKASKNATQKNEKTSKDPESSAKPTKVPRRQRLFSIATYKTHSLGGYAKAIQLYGTTDGYSTQTVCPFPIFCIG